MGFYDHFNKKPEPAYRELASVTPIDPERASRYAAKALSSECENVAAAPEGQRNHALNAAAFSIAQLVAAGHLADSDARAALHAAARMAGLPDHEIEATLASGFRAGEQKPRQVPEQTPLDVPPVTILEAAQHVAEAEGAAGAEDFDLSSYIRAKFPLIDWHELWATEDEDETWIHKPLLPSRRSIAVYSPPKVGKSLVVLELAVGVSRGTEVLGYTPDRPYVVLYVDFENDPRGDVRTRLRAMGVGPDDLDNLKYLSFPTMAHLDTVAGAAELLAAVEAYGAEVVIIDTISRAVGGEENENDTWLNFYRHTGLGLKQAGVACLRLDHTGKDHDKGMRGGSAKYGDVDAVWKLSRVTGETFELECTDHRFRLDPGEDHLVVTREDAPLRHRRHANPGQAAVEAKVTDLVRVLDEYDVDPYAGRDKVRDAVPPGTKLPGRGSGVDLVTEAQLLRRARVELEAGRVVVDRRTGEILE